MYLIYLSFYFCFLKVVSFVSFFFFGDCKRWFPFPSVLLGDDLSHSEVDMVVFSTLLPTWNLEMQSEMCFTWKTYPVFFLSSDTLCFSLMVENWAVFRWTFHLQLSHFFLKLFQSHGNPWKDDCGVLTLRIFALVGFSMWVVRQGWDQWPPNPWGLTWMTVTYPSNVATAGSAENTNMSLGWKNRNRLCSTNNFLH